MSPFRTPIRTTLLVVAALPIGTGCTDSDPAGPEDEPEIATLTVDASEDWAFVAFDGDLAAPVNVSERSVSGSWDMGFLATSVMLNGGAAGPADVTGYCVCQNGSAGDADILAMTPESELADFEAVTVSDIPSDPDAWASDALAAAIDGWYSYDFTTHTTSPAPENVWKVRTASGEAFAKFHVTGLEASTQQHAGQVTFEFAVQPGAGEPFGATTTATVDVSDGPVHYDLESGSEVAADAGWDLLFEGWDIRVNGGVSGSGSAGASLSGESFEAVTDAGDLTSRHYRGDAFGGVFDEHVWYRYNLEDNHQIWPTYDVYLVRRGEDVYKVQLTGYYGPTGESRQVTFRYALLQ